MGKINKIINKIFNRGKFVNNILIVSKKGKYGAVNVEGDIVIDFIYDDLHFFQDYQNFLIGEKNGKNSIIDTKTLKPIVENITFEKFYMESSLGRIYYKESPLNLTLIKDGKGNLGLFDFSTGEYVCGFTYVSFLGDKFIIKQGEKFGVISQDFKTILSPEYDSIYSFRGNFIACKENTSYIITEQNKFYPFDKISQIETLIPTDEDKWRMQRDPYGPVPLPNPFGDCYLHITKNLLIVEKEGKEYLIDFNNNGDIEFLSEGFDQIGKISCAGRLVVKKGKKFGYIDLEGNLVIPCEFDSAEQFKIGLRTEKTYRGVNFEKTIYYKSRKQGTPLAKVGRNGFYGCINVDGTVVIPYVFDEIGEFVDGVAPATFYGVDGQINENGKGFDIEKILSSFNNKENIEKLKEQYDKELGE